MLLHGQRSVWVRVVIQCSLTRQYSVQIYEANFLHGASTEYCDGWQTSILWICIFDHQNICSIYPMYWQNKWKDRARGGGTDYITIQSVIVRYYFRTNAPVSTPQRSMMWPNKQTNGSGVLRVILGDTADCVSVCTLSSYQFLTYPLQQRMRELVYDLRVLTDFELRGARRYHHHVEVSIW